MDVNDDRIPVCVLGATGAVGQRFVALLAEHPWFEVREVVASARSAGKRYLDACEWLAPGALPAGAAELTVRALGEPVDAPLVFSALDASVAREAEEALAHAGKVVCSNASSWRMDPRVPLIVPEVNPSHLALLEAQTDWPGALLTNPNCSTIGLTLALKPLKDAFGLESVSVVSLQAMSGAGTPTLRTLDMLANVVPLIPGEEEKLEAETLKILGELTGDALLPAELQLWSQCNRVPVVDGHTLCVTVQLEDDATEEDLLDVWSSFSSAPQELELPTAPEPVIVVHPEGPAPQPRLHLDAGGGMAIHVGRVKSRGPRAWQFTTLSHNTLRGAAGGSVLVAELALAMGRLPGLRTVGE